MIYDGDCAFCRRWVDRLRHVTGEQIRYESYQKALSDFPQLSETQCQSAVQLVLPDGAVMSGAYATFKALALGGKFRFFLWCYEYVPFFRLISESVYRFIASHRRFF